MDDKKIFGFEVGATKLIALVGDIKGNVYLKEYTKTSNKRSNLLLDQIEYFYKKFSEKFKPDYISVTFPAAIDKSGNIMHAPNLQGWNHKNLIRELRKRFKEKIFVDNDAKAQALAERLYGAGKYYSDFVYFTIGTGIGGAIFINGKLYRGYNGFAGEFGHMVIEENGPKCGCGRYGCLEAIASGRAIAKNAMMNLTKESILNKENKKRIEGKEVFDALKKNDAYAKIIIDKAVEDIAVGIANIINIVDPEAIIIGGGLTKNGAYFINAIKKRVPIELAYYNRKVKIVKAKNDTVEKAPLAVVAYYK